MTKAFENVQVSEHVEILSKQYLHIKLVCTVKNSTEYLSVNVTILLHAEAIWPLQQTTITTTGKKTSLWEKSSTTLSYHGSRLVFNLLSKSERVSIISGFTTLHAITTITKIQALVTCQSKFCLSFLSEVNAHSCDQKSLEMVLARVFGPAGWTCKGPKFLTRPDYPGGSESEFQLNRTTLPSCTKRSILFGQGNSTDAVYKTMPS